MAERKCCQQCKTGTPQKYYGCESPCSAYRAEYAAEAAAKVSLEAKLSVERIKHHNLVEEYEDCILPSDDC